MFAEKLRRAPLTTIHTRIRCPTHEESNHKEIRDKCVGLRLYSSHYTTPRVQVPNNHMRAQILHYNCYYPNPNLFIGYLDPLDSGLYSRYTAVSATKP